MLILGGFCSYFLFTPKRRANQNYNKQIEKKEIKLKALLVELEKTQSNIESLHYEINSEQQNLLELRNTEKTERELISYKTQLENDKYQIAKEEFEKEYLSTLQDRVDEYLKTENKLQQQISETENALAKLKNSMHAALEANRQLEERKENIEFYKIHLPQQDLHDILCLKKTKEQLFNQEILNKLIWKTYFERPAIEMINRVVGTGICCGIYKITDQTTQKIYIGQSVG